MSIIYIYKNKEYSKKEIVDILQNEGLINDNRCSSVIDSNKEPLVVWHGSYSEINIFKPKMDNNGLSLNYFSDNPKVALKYGEYLIPCFLNIRSMDYIDGKGKGFNDAYDNSDLFEKLRATDRGYYDGLHIENIYDNPDGKKKGGKSNVYVVAEPNQIKLADGSNITFDANSDDIRYEQGGLIDDNNKEIYQKWKSLVNMSKSELEDFYNSKEGKEAGLSSSEANKLGINNGRESARWIMKMKETPISKWTPKMWEWAGDQISFISRMSGNKGPLYDEKGNKTRKHTSLLIWGHNPNKMNDGGEIKLNTHQERVNSNLKHMGTPQSEWSAVPIIGFTDIEAEGKTKAMPEFSFPKGYTKAPTLFPNSQTGNMNCELCGRTPIKNAYHLQNDKKKFTLLVGSECVTHFGEGASGKQNLRQFKLNQAEILNKDLDKALEYIGNNFSKLKTERLYTGGTKTTREWKQSAVSKAYDEYYKENVSELVKDGKLDILFNKKNTRKENIYWYDVVARINPFDSDFYEKERTDKDAQFLSWYKRNKESGEEMLRAISLFVKATSGTVLEFDSLQSAEVESLKNTNQEYGRGGFINRRMKFPKHYKSQDGKYGTSDKKVSNNDQVIMESINKKEPTESLYNNFIDNSNDPDAEFNPNYRPLFWHLTKKEFCHYAENYEVDTRLDGTKAALECEDFYKYAVILPLLDKSAPRNAFLLAVETDQLPYDKVVEIIKSVNAWDENNKFVKQLMEYNHERNFNANIWKIPKATYLSSDYFKNNFTKPQADKWYANYMRQRIAEDDTEVLRFMKMGIVKFKDVYDRFSESALGISPSIERGLDKLKDYENKFRLQSKFKVLRMMLDDKLISKEESTRRYESNINASQNRISELEEKILELSKIFPQNQKDFTERLINDTKNGVKHNKVSLEKLAREYGINEQNTAKELAELAISFLARIYGHEHDLTPKERYEKIVSLYKNQVNLSHRTSSSILFQQYSTPAPIGFVAGLFVGFDKPGNYFEPSAGNGLLTIAGDPKDFIVNEIDDLRNRNLQVLGFSKVLKQDATNPFIGYEKSFDGVITNPPFGSTEGVAYGKTDIKSLEQLMCLRALDTMKDNGRAALIIGGHLEYDAAGRIKAGKNRSFFVYLYNNYHVMDVINIDGHALYSRQGTSFNVRLILIDGRKEIPAGYPLIIEEPTPATEINSYTPVKTFEDLWNRVQKSM